MKVSELVDELSARFEELTRTKRTKFMNQLRERHSELNKAQTEAFREAKKATEVKVSGWIDSDSRFKPSPKAFSGGRVNFRYLKYLFYFESFPKSVTIGLENVPWEERIAKNIKIPKTGGGNVFCFLVAEACDLIIEENETKQVVDA